MDLIGECAFCVSTIYFVEAKFGKKNYGKNL